jgi:Mn2+/Fe2+ NRAMP family transporter
MSLRSRISSIGPAALVTAAFIGPGTVTTCTMAGAKFGYALLWGMLFSVIATIILQEMSARLGIVTQKGLGEAIRESTKTVWSKAVAITLVLSAIVIGNAAFETGNVLGGGLGLETICGWNRFHIGSVSFNGWALITGFMAFILLWTGSSKAVEKVLVTLVILMSLAFIGTTMVIGPDMTKLLKGLLVPSIPKGSLLTLVGLIGTTVVPYNLFLHASAASEKWKNPDDLGKSWLDILVSISLGGLISMAIIIAAAVSFYGTDAILKNAADIAGQLQPLLGKWARISMAIGLFAAGFTSAITAPLAAAYAARGILGWNCDRSNWKFRSVWLSILLIGMIFSQIGASPVEAILFAQVANGILLPIIAGYLLWIMNQSSLLGNYRNKLFANFAGGAVVLITIILGARTILVVLKVI